MIFLNICLFVSGNACYHKSGIRPAGSHSVNGTCLSWSSLFRNVSMNRSVIRPELHPLSLPAKQVDPTLQIQAETDPFFRQAIPPYIEIAVSARTQ